MIKRLRNRMLLLNMLVLTAVTLLAIGAVYAATYAKVMQGIEGQADQSGLRTATNRLIMSRLLEAPGTGGAAIDEAPFYVAFPRGERRVLCITYDEAGTMIGSSTNTSLTREDVRTAVATWGAARPGQRIVSFAGRRWYHEATVLTPASPASPSGLIVEVGDPAAGGQASQATRATVVTFMDVTKEMAALDELLRTCLMVGAAMLAVLFGISYAFARQMAKPVEAAWQQQRRFVADASHELRTPLAVISASVDALEADTLAPDAERRRWTEGQRQAVERMDRLVGGLLDLASAEGAEPDRVPIDLAELVEECGAGLEAAAFERGVEYREEASPGVIVKADRARLAQAVLILMDNAIRHNEPGGWVRVTLVREHSRARLTVSNSGPGIPAEELPRVFDRFYRGDLSRSGQEGGFGLGLSIAQAIVERAGGSIAAASSGGVTDFSITLPLA